MRWFFSAAVLFFGIITIDLKSLMLSVLGILIFSLPLILQFTRHKEVHIWALWGGGFFILQSLLSPILINKDFITLQPYMHRIIDIKAGIPGINGEQSITTDIKGFRTTKEIDYRDNKTYRVFAIGGSTTEQIYLDDRDTWTHLLQERLSTTSQSEVEVINTGVSGLRAKHHLATLQNIIGLHPDLVLFLVGINDWNWSIKEAFLEDSSSLYTMIADYRTDLLLRNTLVGNFVYVVTRTLKNAKKEKLTPVKNEYGEYYSKQRGSLSRNTVFSFHPEDVSKRYAEYIMEIGDTCHENNIRCLFITQPTGYQKDAGNEFKKGFWMTPPNQSYTLDFESMVYIAHLYNSYLTKFSVENNYLICDAASALTPTFNNFYDDTHFNTQGAKNMSVVIDNCIEEINSESQHNKPLNKKIHSTSFVGG